MSIEPTSPAASAEAHIAFAACPAGRGSLLRVGLAVDARRRPTKARLTACPNCGGQHPASLLWRRQEDRDEGKAPAVVVDVEGQQV